MAAALRVVLVPQIREYRRLEGDGAFVDERAWSDWLAAHPEFRAYWHWYQGTAEAQEPGGGTAWASAPTNLNRYVDALAGMPLSPAPAPLTVATRPATPVTGDRPQGREVRSMQRHPEATQEEWVAFWRWAQAYGCKNRADLDRAAGCPTSALHPLNIRGLIEGRPKDPAPPSTAGATASPHERAEFWRKVEQRQTGLPAPQRAPAPRHHPPAAPQESADSWRIEQRRRASAHDVTPADGALPISGHQVPPSYEAGYPFLWDSNAATDPPAAPPGESPQVKYAPPSPPAAGQVVAPWPRAVARPAASPPPARSRAAGRRSSSTGGDDSWVYWLIAALIVGGLLYSGADQPRRASSGGEDRYAPPSYEYGGAGSGGCGSRGGPGYRLSNGKCASWDDYYRR